MLTQTIKAWGLFLSSLFIIMAIQNYFGAGKVYPVLISVSFIIHIIGEVAILVIGWRYDRRKFELPTEDKQPWMWRRQAD